MGIAVFHAVSFPDRHVSQKEKFSQKSLIKSYWSGLGHMLYLKQFGQRGEVCCLTKVGACGLRMEEIMVVTEQMLILNWQKHQMSTSDTI